MSVSSSRPARSPPSAEPAPAGPRLPPDYVLTGRNIVRGLGGLPEWLEERAPYTLETSMPGVFAAVADGATAIGSVREYLGQE